MGIKAYSYIRFSTPEQIKGDSLNRQLQLSKSYAKHHNLILDKSPVSQLSNEVLNRSISETHCVSHFSETGR